jgi:hypothetical protein
MLGVLLDTIKIPVNGYSKPCKNDSAYVIINKVICANLLFIGLKVKTIFIGFTKEAGCRKCLNV